VKDKSEWLSFLPGGLAPANFSLDELRNVKQVHSLLTEPIAGPAGMAYYIRGFRYLLFFGIACIAEDKYPPLTRCWKDLEQLFMGDPAFDDGLFVESWILMDFPFGPKRQTALDHFQEFLKATDMGTHLQRFVDEARRSRLGLHQDVMRTKKVAKFRELFTGNVMEAVPSVEGYGNGEILLTRTMEYDGQTFIFGDPKGFPREKRSAIENMVANKLFFFDDAETPVAQYETFMKLAGPYWMSCVAENNELPILAPDHYLTHLG